MSPAASWLLLSILFGWTIWAAIYLYRRQEDAEWRQWEEDLDEWRAACAALEDTPYDTADEQPHRGE